MEQLFQEDLILEFSENCASQGINLKLLSCKLPPMRVYLFASNNLQSP